MAIITSIFEFFFIGLYMVFFINYVKNREYLKLINFISASAFGITLEYLSIYIFDNYHYSENFIIQLGNAPNNVPIVIGLCWGMIIVSSMRISDTFGIRKRYRPFMDTLQAMLIDFTMDVTAIRIEGGFWDWGIPQYTEINSSSYFGVPWGNYLGWFLIVLTFSFTIRLNHHLWNDKINTKVIIYNILAPLFSYLPLYLGLEGTKQSYLFLLRSGVNFPWYTFSIVATLHLIALIVVIRAIRSSINIDPDSNTRLAVILQTSFHVFYLTAFIYLGLLSSIPLAGLIAGILFVINLVIHYQLHRLGK